MSKIRNAFFALLAISALTFNNVSHAETPDVKEGQQTVVDAVVYEAQGRLQQLVDKFTSPVIDVKELQCLARNIFYESASEPEEGKVAVGLVTLNRVRDGRFGKSVCTVVNQRTTTMVERRHIREVRTVWGTKREPVTVWEKFTICQFSWRCMATRTPRSQDERWVESQRIAEDLLSSDSSYVEYRDKYENALYFHATHVRPSWAHQKALVGRIGGHKFYEEKVSSRSF